jgi:plasmid stability protein
MSVTLSIKNVPDHVAEKLRRRAERHHRSLQGELMAIIEQSVAAAEPLTPAEVFARVRAMGLQTPEESATLVREDRDGRSNR